MTNTLSNPGGRDEHNLGGRFLANTRRHAEFLALANGETDGSGGHIREGLFPFPPAVMQTLFMQTVIAGLLIKPGDRVVRGVRLENFLAEDHSDIVAKSVPDVMFWRASVNATANAAKNPLRAWNRTLGIIAQYDYTDDGPQGNEYGVVTAESEVGMMLMGNGPDRLGTPRAYRTAIVYVDGRRLLTTDVELRSVTPTQFGKFTNNMAALIKDPVADSVVPPEFYDIDVSGFSDDFADTISYDTYFEN